MPQDIKPVSGLERRRRELRLRQVDLAERIGVSRSLIAVVERGYVPAGRSRAKIAAGLEIAQKDLWPDEPEWGPEA